MSPLLLVALAALLLVSLVGVFVTQLQRGSFEKRFPPISEAEFLARCAPGTDPKVALKVRRIVAERLGVEYARIYPSSRFVEDLGAD